MAGGVLPGSGIAAGRCRVAAFIHPRSAVRGISGKNPPFAALTSPFEPVRVKMWSCLAWSIRRTAELRSFQQPSAYCLAEVPAR